MRTQYVSASRRKLETARTSRLGRMLVLVVAVEPRKLGVTGVTPRALISALTFVLHSNRPSGIRKSWGDSISLTKLLEGG